MFLETKTNAHHVECKRKRENKPEQCGTEYDKCTLYVFSAVQLQYSPLVGGSGIVLQMTINIRLGYNL